MIAALRNKRFLVFGGAAVILLLILGGSFLMHLRQYYALHLEGNSAKQRLQTLRQAIQGVNLDALKQENQALADELGEIERSLPEREYIPTLIRQIESGAEVTGNDLEEVKQGEIRKGLVAAIGGAEEAATATTGAAATPATQGAAAAAPKLHAGQRYSEMDIEVRLKGTYVGAFEFVRHLGQIGKIIAVDLVEIEKSAIDEVRPDGRAAASIRLNCKAYILEPRSGFPGQVAIKVY